MIIEPDAWLTQIFGYQVLRVLPSEHAETTFCHKAFGETVREASNGSPAFCYAKVPVDRIDQVSALIDAGFTVVEVNVTFERETIHESPRVMISSPLVRDAEDRDDKAVLNIASTCFRYSRFHLDPLIPRHIADLVKREWVQNYLLGNRGDRLLVAEWEGEPVGFLCVLSVRNGGQRIGIIDLMGVGTEHQGKGVGKALIQGHIATAFRRYDMLKVGTQMANIPSMRLYESCGYRIRQTAYVLHAHVERS